MTDLKANSGRITVTGRMVTLEFNLAGTFE